MMVTLDDIKKLPATERIVLLRELIEQLGDRDIKLAKELQSLIIETERELVAISRAKEIVPTIDNVVREKKEASEKKKDKDIEAVVEDEETTRHREEKDDKGRSNYHRNTLEQEADENIRARYGGKTENVYTREHKDVYTSESKNVYDSTTNNSTARNRDDSTREPTMERDHRSQMAKDREDDKKKYHRN